MIERTATDDFEPLWSFGMVKPVWGQCRRQFANFAPSDPDASLHNVVQYTENQCSLTAVCKPRTVGKPFLGSPANLRSGWDETLRMIFLWPKCQINPPRTKGLVCRKAWSMHATWYLCHVRGCGRPFQRPHQACVRGNTKRTQPTGTDLHNRSAGKCVRDDNGPGYAAARCAIPGAAADAYFSEGSL